MTKWYFKHPTLAQKVCHQGVKTSYMRFVTGGDMERQQVWSKPNPPWGKEDVWRLQKHHPLTHNSTGRATMGLFHQNYWLNQHNARNKFLAGIKSNMKRLLGTCHFQKRCNKSAGGVDSYPRWIRKLYKITAKYSWSAINWAIAEVDGL